MNVQIHDREALSSIPIENLRTYLASAGCQIRGQWGERPAAIFARESRARTWEITVPYNDAVAGYAEGMAEAVKVLSTVEERSQLDVLHDLASTQVGDAGEMWPSRFQMRGSIDASWAEFMPWAKGPVT